jgi:hypothetical protein
MDALKKEFRDRIIIVGCGQHPPLISASDFYLQGTIKHTMSRTNHHKIE